MGAAHALAARDGLRHIGGVKRLLLSSLLAWPSLAVAAPGAGTAADPLRIDALPYAWKATTAGAPSSVFDAYAPCAPNTDESGPEVIFSFTLAEETRVSAWVEGDGGAVDVDVQILDDLAASGAVASSCLARGNKIAEAVLQAGTHYVVVDSYGGAAQAGPFVLRVDGVGASWSERAVADGVIWRRRRWVHPQLGAQLEHVLLVDLGAPGVSLEAVPAAGCQTVGALGAAVGAVAGVNGGYFDTSGGCAPVSLLRHQGALVATNAKSRGAFGVGAGAAQVAQVPAGDDWPEVDEAHGGGPVVVALGAALSGNAQWATEGISDPGFIGPNPRTFAGVHADGRAVLGTVDGRRDTAKGMSLDQLAAHAASDDVGCVDAVNLDGGGSTTLWIAGHLLSGVANYPSDGPADENALHEGSRGTSGGLFVFAPPYDHPPRFQTAPIEDAKAGEPYVYDADALDLDVDDALTFSLSLGPAGMAVDPVTGVVTWSPTTESPSSVEVVLSVSDDQGAHADQSFVLVTAGATGDPIGGGGQGGSIGGQGGDPGSAPAAGCSCGVGGGAGSGSAAALAALAVLARGRGRRRPRHPAIAT